MRFDDTEFLDLVRPFVQLDDGQIATALRRGTIEVARQQHFFRRYVPQQGIRVEYDDNGNFVGQREGEGNDPRIFHIRHEDWDFGRIKQFIDLETRRHIDIDTGQPDIHLESNPNRTTIVCEFFDDSNNGAGIMAAADIALVPTKDTEEIDDLVFRQYTLLLQAATMKELQEFGVKHLAGMRNWAETYRMLSDAALERYSPDRHTLGATHSCIRPRGGGVDDANTHRFGGNIYGFYRRTR